MTLPSEDEDERQLIGSIIDHLGVKAIIEPSQRITEVLVVAKLTDFEDGSTSLGVYNSSGVDWIALLGLLRAAQILMEITQFSHTEED